MKILLVLLCLLAIAFSNAASKDLVKFTVSSYLFPNKVLEMQMDFVVPKESGSYTTAVYLTGLSGLTPYGYQQQLVDSIAESGVIIMTVSKLQNIKPQHVTKVMVKIIDWINTVAQGIITNKVPGVIADLDNRFILMSHSAGGHVNTQYLNGTCGNVKMQILLDPVDGADPFGILNDFITHPGEMLPYASPTLVIASELDSTPRKLQPACAANNISNLRFYNAMSGPKWYLNFTKYGHNDFFNDYARELSTVMCPTCKSGCNFAQYRSVVKSAVLSFIDAIFDKNALSLKILEQGEFLVKSEHQHDYMGYDVFKMGGFCERTKTKSLLVNDS